MMDSDSASLLVVDDTPANLQLLLDTLTGAGYKVLVATNGEEALERAEISLLDLILLDVVMPGIDGFETCRRLQESPALQDVPVIFMSALNDIENKMEGFTAGGVDYITKPFRHEEVLARVDTHLRLRRLQHSLAARNQQLQRTGDQLQAITDALTQFLQTNSRGKASTVLLDCALQQTQSRFGFIGLLNHDDQRADIVRVIALQGALNTDAEGQPLFAELSESFDRDGYAELSLDALETWIGPVASDARKSLAALDRQTLPDTATPIPSARPPFFASAAIHDQDVVGIMALSGRDGDYLEAEQTSVVRLNQAAGVLLGYERLQQRQVDTERRRRRAEEQVRYLEDALNSEHNFDEVVGTSAALRRVFTQVERVAKTDSTVLIGGETGTGKELIARAIHRHSARREQALIRVNCAALPENLIESELFGHEKGAFTGALQQRKGRFELADGGTLFLDEIGDMSLAAQVKLLRVLQEQEFERLGGSRTIRVNVRVIAATHRDLQALAAGGDFREDLYYRLNVFPIEVPPLRERPEDIMPLVEFFVARLSTKFGVRIDGIRESDAQRLQAYHWPGNVRELENVVERAVILSNAGKPDFSPDTLALASRTEPSPAVASTAPALEQPPDEPLSLDEVQRQHILKTLEKTHWKIAGERGAAKLLGLNPTTLRHRMSKLDIRKSP